MDDIPQPISPGSLKLMDSLRADLRAHGYALTTERTYLYWIKRFIFFHSYRNPRCMGKTEIEQLARDFVALFLKTDFSDGSYQIEQEHHLFVVDPKGRVYATFRPPYTSRSIQSQFLKLRYFYAQSE